MGLRPDLKVLLLHNLPGESARESDRGVLDEVNAVSTALDALRIPHRIAGVRGLDEIPAVLAAGTEPVVFNLVEGFDVRPENAAFVPALCLGYGKAVTGNPTECLVLTLDKTKTKAVFAAAGIPVPSGTVVAPGKPVPRERLPGGPYIVKPSATDASEGIRAETSIVPKAGPALEAAVRAVHKEFDQTAVIEQMVGTRELNVSIIQKGKRVTVLPIAEIDFSAFGAKRPRIVDYAAKWLPDSFAFRNTPRVIPADIPRKVARHVQDLSVAAWEAAGCADYARVDFRLADNGDVWVLELNANPDIAPDAGFAAALQAGAVPFSGFVRQALENALGRQAGPVVARSDRKETDAPGALVRPARRADRDGILAMLRNAAVFRSEELEIAREVLDESLERGAKSGYVSWVADVEGRSAGWIAFGEIPCTVGAFDIYWIVVDAARQRGGIGKVLMSAAVEEMKRLRARVILVETSGRTIYDPARRFYGQCGFVETGRIPDCYAPGDDKVIFMRRLDGLAPS